MGLSPEQARQVDGDELVVDVLDLHLSGGLIVELDEDGEDLVCHSGRLNRTRALFANHSPSHSLSIITRNLSLGLAIPASTLALM